MRYSAIPILYRTVALRLLAAAQSPKTDGEGRFCLSGLVASGQAYEVYNSLGDTVAAYVVEPSNGALWITAAAGKARDNLVVILSRFAEHQAYDLGLSAVGFRTERRGLVRKALRIGYTITRQDGNEYFLRKSIKC